MEIKVKIQSIIDVITNSSSEIYISTRENGITTIKELINLCTMGRCDELFNISIDDDDDVDYPEYAQSRYVITAKNNNNTTDKRVAEILSNLEDLFSYEAAYN